MKINVNDEKLIDELVLVLKLFYTQEQIDNLDYVFDITQQVNDMEITTQLDFLDFYEKERYNGIWACSSILHLNSKELLRVLKNISAALKPDGIFYTSFKYGTFEGERNGRFFNDMT